MRETDTASPALKLEDVRAATIRWLAGKKRVRVDWRKILINMKSRPVGNDEDGLKTEDVEIIKVMRYFTLVKSGSSLSCILHQDMYFIAGIGERADVYKTKYIQEDVQSCL